MRLKQNALLLIWTVLLCTLLPSDAHADTVFTVNGTLSNGTAQDGLTLDGTISINTSTGVLTSADLNVMGFGTGTIHTVIGALSSNFGTALTLVFSDGAGDFLFLGIPNPTLVNFTGANFCITSLSGGVNGPCTTIFDPYSLGSDFQVFDPQYQEFHGYPFTSGTIEPISAPVTEPNLVLLLVFGLLALALRVGVKRLHRNLLAAAAKTSSFCQEMKSL
jgi:hypothetical protein